MSSSRIDMYGFEPIKEKDRIVDIDLAYDKIQGHIDSLIKEAHAKLKRLIMEKFKNKGYDFEGSTAAFEAFCIANVRNIKLDGINHLIIESTGESICTFKSITAYDFNSLTGTYTLQII